MGKRSTKKRGPRKKGQTRRYRFRGGADCTKALETCDSLVGKLEPLAAEVRKLHKHLKENARLADDGDDDLFADDDDDLDASVEEEPTGDASTEETPAVVDKVVEDEPEDDDDDDEDIDALFG